LEKRAEQVLPGSEGERDWVGTKYIGNSIRYSILINIPFCDLGKEKDIFCEYF
jgi:hypothetical protein